MTKAARKNLLKYARSWRVVGSTPISLYLKVKPLLPEIWMLDGKDGSSNVNWADVAASIAYGFTKGPPCPNARRYRGIRRPRCSGGKCEECLAIYRRRNRA